MTKAHQTDSWPGDSKCYSGRPSARAASASVYSFGPDGIAYPCGFYRDRTDL